MRKGMCLFLCVLVLMLLPLMNVPSKHVPEKSAIVQRPTDVDIPPRQSIPAAGPITTHYKVGPFIDEIVFKAVGNEAELANALLNNEIDLIDAELASDYLEGNASIVTSNYTRNGYGLTTINCDRYPYNITDFRRALAFALNKWNASDLFFNGWSQPLDSPVPRANPYSIEGTLSYDYYEEDLVTASQLLDDAGFALNVSGYRKAPDDSMLTVEVSFLNSSAVQTQWASLLIDTLQKLDIDAVGIELDVSGWFNNILGVKDYDIGMYGNALSDNSVEWLADEYWSGNVDVSSYNIPKFSNATFDSWRAQLVNSTDQADIIQAAEEMQKIIIHACPVIVTYENIYSQAHRDDVFTNFYNDFYDGISCFWTNYKAYQKGDDPYGGSLRWGMENNITTFNFMNANYDDRQILSNMYDSLIRRAPDGTNIPWLAESYIIETNSDNLTIPVGGSRITFDLIQNATWNDGSPLDAEDVVYSIQFYQGNSTNPYYDKVQHVTSVTNSGNYRVYVEFDRESYWGLHEVGYIPIIPKHVFEPMGPDAWEEWDPDPRTDFIVTSGPFNITDWTVGESVTMTYNPDYFFGNSRLWNNPDGDYWYEEGTTSNHVLWTPTCDHPASYETLLEGSSTGSGPWDGTDIQVTFDTPDIDVLNYTLVVYDTDGFTQTSSMNVFVHPPATGTIVFDYSHGQGDIIEAASIDNTFEQTLLSMGFTTIWARGGINSSILSGVDALMLGGIWENDTGYTSPEITAITDWFNSGDKFLWVGTDSDYNVWEHINSNMTAILEAVGSHVYTEPASVEDSASNAGSAYRVIARVTSNNPYTTLAVKGTDAVLMHGPTLLYGSDSATPGVGVSPVALESVSIPNVYPLLYYCSTATIYDWGGDTPYAHTNSSTGSFVTTTIETEAGTDGTSLIAVSGAGQYGDYRPMTTETYQGYSMNGHRIVRQLLTLAMSGWFTRPTINQPSNAIYNVGETSNTITWVPTDTQPDSYEIFRNGTPWDSDVWDGSSILCNVDGLVEGTHNFTIVVYDINSNWISSTVWVTVGPDLIDPAIDHPYDDVFDEGTSGHEIIWSPSDLNPVSYSILRNGSPFKTGDWNSSSETITIEISWLPYGVHNFTITVTDFGGNSASDTVLVTVEDGTPPELTHPNDISYNEGTTTMVLTWQGTDLHPTYYEIFKDTTSVFFDTWTSISQDLSYDVGGDSFGTYTYRIRVIDIDGNWADDYVTVTVLDPDPPSVSRPSDLDISSDASVNIEWILNDNHPSNYEVYRNGSLIDSGVWTDVEYTVVVEVYELPDGDYNYTIIAFDLQGNSNSDQVWVIVRTSSLEPGIQFYQIAGAGGTIFLLLICALYIRQRSTSKKETPAPVPMAKEGEVQVLRGCAAVGGKFEYKVKVKNNTRFVINNVTVTIIAYPEDCMELSGEDKKRLSRVEPGGFRSPQFTFIPTKDCVEGKIQSSVSYVDAQDKLESIEVEPYTIRSVCDLLEPMESTMEEFELMLMDMSASREEVMIEWNPEVLFSKAGKLLPNKNFHIIESESSEEGGIFTGSIRGLAEGKYTQKKVAVRIVITGPVDGETSKVVIEGLGDDEAMLPTTIEEITKGIDAWICMNCGSGLEPEDVTVIKSGASHKCSYCGRTMTIDLYRR